MIVGNCMNNMHGVVVHIYPANRHIQVNNVLQSGGGGKKEKMKRVKQSQSFKLTLCNILEVFKLITADTQIYFGLDF